MNVHDMTEQAYKNGYDKGWGEGYDKGYARVYAVGLENAKKKPKKQNIITDRTLKALVKMGKKAHGDK